MKKDKKISHDPANQYLDTEEPLQENSMQMLQSQHESELLDRIHALQARQTELEIQNEALRQTNLLQNVSDAVITVDHRFLITGWNKAAQIIYGWQAREVIGRYSEEILTTTCSKDQIEDQQTSIRQKGSWVGEIQQFKKDGTPVYIHTSISRISDKDGKIIGAIAINRDITEHKLAEDDQRQIKTLFEGLFNNAPDAIFWVNGDSGLILACNPAGERLVGRPAHDLIGQPHTLLYPPELSKQYQSFFIEKGKNASGVEAEIINVNGQHISVNILSTTFRQGNQTIIQGIFQDISLQKENQERFVRYERIMASVQDAIAVLDKGYVFIEVNRAAVTMFGRPHQQLIGSHLYDVMGKEAFEESKVHLDRSLQGETVQTGKWYERSGGGMRYYTVTYSPFYDQNQELSGVMTVSRDITSLRQTREALSKSRKRYIDLFEHAPIPIIETDFSGVKKALNQLGERGISDYGAYFRHHPDEVPRIMSKIKITDANQACLYLFNIPSKDQIVARFGAAHQDSHKVHKFTSILKSLSEGQMIEEIELNMPFESEEHWLKLNIVIDPDLEETFERVLISFTDLTAHKHAEEVLRQSEERFRTLFETMGQGVIYFNSQGFIIQANPAAKKILGLAPNVLLGKNTLETDWKIIRRDGSFMPNEEKPSYLAMKTGKIIPHTLFGFYNSELQNYRWLETTAVPQFRPGEEHPFQTYIIFDDITERRNAEQIKETLLNKTRQQAERMNAIIQISSSLRQAQTNEDAQLILAQQSKMGLRADATLLTLTEGKNLWFSAGSGSWENQNGLREGALKGSFKHILEKGSPVFLYTRDEIDEIHLPACFRSILKSMHACILIPLKVVDASIGLLMAGYTQGLDYSEDRVSLAATIGEIAGNTLQRMRLMASLERLAADRTRDLATLYNIISAASGSFDLHQVLSQALEEVLSTAGAQDGAILLINQATHVFTIASEKGLIDQARRLLGSQPISDTIESWVVEHSEPLLIPNVASDTRFHVAEKMKKELYIYLGLPMRARGQVIGVISLFRKGILFNVEEITLLSSIADHIALISDNLALYQRVEQAAVLEERSRLARDLHDSATQSLYSVTLYAEASRTLAQQGDVNQLNKYLDRLAQASQQALSEMRLLVYELRPPSLEQDGLAVALRKRLEAVEGRSGIQTHLEVESIITLEHHEEEHMFWIAMEALNNSLRHSEATQVNMCIKIERGQVVLSVSDNGKGFNAKQSSQSSGMGLNNMQQRASKINGKLQITSLPGQGTTVTIRLPDHGTLGALSTTNIVDLS